MKNYLLTMSILTLLTGCFHDEETTLPNPNVPTPSNLINGEVPPMRPTRALEQSIAVQVIDGGRELLTERTIREVGTRAPIHIHPYGGQTCIAEGEMTLYMDGSEPARAVAGTCYFMPSTHRMTGVNTGSINAVMFDSFVIPVGEEVWQIVEPGQEDAVDLLQEIHKK